MAARRNKQKTDSRASWKGLLQIDLVAFRVEAHNAVNAEDTSR